MVLDGGSARLKHAERFRQQVLQEHPRPGRPLEPAHLLIRCPRASSPPQPMPELLRGYDTPLYRRWLVLMTAPVGLSVQVSAAREWIQ